MPSRAVQQRAYPAPTSRASERMAHRVEASAACNGAVLDSACVLRERCRSTARATRRCCFVIASNFPGLLLHARLSLSLRWRCFASCNAMVQWS